MIKTDRDEANNMPRRQKREHRREEKNGDKNRKRQKTIINYLREEIRRVREDDAKKR